MFLGQCHMCRTTNETLETTWILREQVDTCGDNWKATIYGVSSFTRHEQKPGMPHNSDIIWSACLSYHFMVL